MFKQIQRKNYQLFIIIAFVVLAFVAGIFFAGTFDTFKATLNKQQQPNEILKTEQLTLNFEGRYHLRNQKGKESWIRIINSGNSFLHVYATPDTLGLTGFANADIIGLTGFANGNDIGLIGTAQDPNDPQVSYRTDLNGTGYDDNRDGTADRIDFDGTVTLLNNDAPVDQEVIKFKTYRK